MFCCGGAEEENAGPPANQNTAPPRGNNPVGGNLLLQLIVYTCNYKVLSIAFVQHLVVKTQKIGILRSLVVNYNKSLWL